MNFEKIEPFLLYLLIICASFFFIFYLPQKKKKKEVENMQNKIKVGDKVVTIGGIVGIVISIEKDIIVLEVSDHNDYTRIIRSAIQYVVK